MSEEIKDVNAKIDAAEDAVKKYASADTVISIGGYEFTPAKLMVAFTLVSSILGGLYGCFEVYKDYQDMKTKITKYVAPDLSEFDKRLAVIEQNSSKTTDYTNEIKNDLKGDIRRVEKVTEDVERESKQSQRETDQAVRDVRDEVRRTSKETETAIKQVQRETETAIKQVQREVDTKIQKALDNPLAR